MTKNNTFRHIIELNIAIIFMSTSGALARYIELPVPVVIASRALFGGMFIYLFCRWKGFNLKINKKDRGVIVLSGVLMGLHWVTYFYALVLSSVAVGMISLFTFPVITSLLEPLMLKKKFQKLQLLLGLMTLVGVYFLVPEFSFENDYFKALVVGVISAVFYSLRNIITKSKVQSYNGSVIMMYQLIIIAVVFSPMFIIYKDFNFVGELPGVLLLSLLTTAIGHTLFLYSLKNFSVTSISLMSSSQLLYGVVIGIIFLSEYPRNESIIGGVIIFATVVLESLRTYKRKVK
ncbi:DMT family transporter [Labilibacter marinus]|uniref:DMT family transporter n=1 Tax=Labilibacter marinus TaxID=1477105 RepID=UPI0009502D46|nr:DMT family transporter [Labilibacter marinus]